MLDITRDTQSLTTFAANPASLSPSSRRPGGRTVNGKAQAVVQDAEAYQRLLDIAARAHVFEGIPQGLDDAANGRMRPARKVFEDVRRKYRVPR